jgi:hypothetical protein
MLHSFDSICRSNAFYATVEKTVELPNWSSVSALLGEYAANGAVVPPGGGLCNIIAKLFAEKKIAALILLRFVHDGGKYVIVACLCLTE